MTANTAVDNVIAKLVNHKPFTSSAFVDGVNGDVGVNAETGIIFSCAPLDWARRIPAISNNKDAEIWVLSRCKLGEACIMNAVITAENRPA